MQDFEKLLSDLPKPAVEVPEFRRRLRAELLAAGHRRAPVGLRWALGVAASLALGFGLLAGMFVLEPELPARLHAALTGAPAPAFDLATELDDLPLRETGASIALDREFIEDWSADQPQPVGVRSMESEQVYTVRRFELTNGKRILVFTELGQDREPYRAAAPTPARQVF